MEKNLLEAILEKTVNIGVYLNTLEFEEIEKIQPLIDERGELLRQFFSVNRSYSEREVALLRKIWEADIVVQRMLEEKNAEFIKEFSGIKRGKQAMKNGYLKIVEEIRPQRNFSSEG